MNSGTNRGGASGVRLHGLLKLAETKSNANKNSSLLDYLTQHLTEKMPGFWLFACWI